MNSIWAPDNNSIAFMMWLEKCDAFMLRRSRVPMEHLWHTRLSVHNIPEICTPAQAVTRRQLQSSTGECEQCMTEKMKPVLAFVSPVLKLYAALTKQTNQNHVKLQGVSLRVTYICHGFFFKSVRLWAVVKNILLCLIKLYCTMIRCHVLTTKAVFALSLKFVARAWLARPGNPPAEENKCFMNWHHPAQLAVNIFDTPRK